MILQWKMLICITAIWYILWPFDTFHGHLVYFSPFWYVVPWKIWQPCLRVILVKEIIARMNCLCIVRFQNMNGKLMFVFLIGSSTFLSNWQPLRNSHFNSPFERGQVEN
jgi:hypothetical protein